MKKKSLVKDAIFAIGAICMTAVLLDFFNLCPVSTFFSSLSISLKFTAITAVVYMLGWLDAKLYEK